MRHARTLRTLLEYTVALSELSSVLFSLKYQLPVLQASGGGAIVNNASNLAITGAPGMASYSAAKHGVVGLTRSAALDVAATGVPINALVTGGVDTPLLRNNMGLPPEEAVRVAGALHPIGRIAQPDEIAAFVAFLLSDEATFITGAALAIDGGMTAAWRMPDGTAGKAATRQVAAPAPTAPGCDAPAGVSGVVSVMVRQIDGFVLVV
ncbi:SDR family oxidoreductase [Streptomyces sp. NPDC002206]